MVRCELFEASLGVLGDGRRSGGTGSARTASMTGRQYTPIRSETACLGYLVPGESACNSSARRKKRSHDTSPSNARQICVPYHPASTSLITIKLPESCATARLASASVPCRGEPDGGKGSSVPRVGLLTRSTTASTRASAKTTIATRQVNGRCRHDGRRFLPVPFIRG